MVSKFKQLVALPLLAGLLTAQTTPDIKIEPVPSPEVLRSEAFVAAQYALISGAAAALDRVTARYAAGSGGLAVLEQERDKKLAEIEAVDRQFSALIERGSAVPEEERRTLTQRRAALRDEVTAIEAKIQKDFPQYFDLTRPKALDIAQVQKLLNPDEAMVMILVSDDASYTWAITREKASWSRSEAMKEEALAAKVKALRASMQVDGARGSARQPPRAAGATGPAPGEQVFDRKVAYEIYKELLAPSEAVLAGKKVLLTNVTGPLTSLPLSLLLTAPPQGSDTDAVAVATSAWLIDKYALAELPSVSSLRSLRCLLIANPADAHPGCDVKAASASYAQAKAGSVALAAYGAPTLAGKFTTADKDRSVTPDLAGSMYDGKLANTEKLRALAYLPQAAAELKSLGATFGDKAQVVLGDAATETAVKQSKVIPAARFVVFSTHGLLATEVGDNAEPGLVFTPPKTATPLDDGLLTASEVAQLNLRADLVALSACNTAASSGKPGAEGLSGLARAFIFAGARSLMVSHWAVSDEATSLLMRETFQHIERGDVAGRARALQAAMKTVREAGSGQFVSPKFWAAFSLVGDPGK
ncbi:CHAT domain-containing protein [Sphingomonas sp.]|uniref:CHAT domain-containing protein n=1 Tax=Sphingomonas sp. TaxID=28214 RepID=UPI001EC9E4C5|nr:CHAT domain-containing protein [Sphingomonas sp.]MBX3594695.1 CHAT domain-containing protein [Sphingomonas sp.]